MNLLEFQKRFPDEASCEAHLIAMRWPEGYVCESCGSVEAYYISNRHTYECKHCGHQHSITANTMFHRSRTPLLEWFLAIYLVCESKKGISGLELAHHLGMRDERRAYRLKKAIQAAMAARNSLYLLEHFVELDEAFMGGKGNKTPVMVAVSVDGEGKPQFARLQVLENLTGSHLCKTAKQIVSQEADVVTDAFPSHNGFSEMFNEHIACVQETPEQSKEYLPWVHIMISNAKRFLNGTHHSVRYLQGYLEEFTWRFNRRFCNLFNRMLVSATQFKPAYLP